ncbi:MAG: lysine--tRNA ligase [Spirochaetes bacterium]|nr:lysine--tRNA ligase [Spirochaetota bacterium]
MNQEAHWADAAAEALIAKSPTQELFTLASGITPSGTVHIGNFRELITVDFVKRALEKKGKKTRFIFSWDDYDVFRKVPANMPRQEELKKFLGKPIVKTPDPFGKENSYARYHEVAMEESIRKVGIQPEFIYQEKKYRASAYAAQMREALEHRGEIAAILDQYREEPLPADWTPVSVFCTKCESNETKVKAWDGAWGITYACRACQHGETIDLRECGAAKLLWRVDWPMRWGVEKVDFEPGGKDHSTAGGSFDTAKQIVQKVWKRDPPQYLMYDFIRIKGRGGKISSSKGEVVTLEDCLRIYEPEMVRWLFASYRPGVEFAISFDLDVIKYFEDWDRLERRYFGQEAVEEDQRAQAKRVYELSMLDKPPAAMPFQPAFRHLTTVLQIYLYDYAKTAAHYEPHLKTPEDRKRFEARFHCAVNWLSEHAPQDFKFKLRDTKDLPPMSENARGAMGRLAEWLRANGSSDEEAVQTEVFQVIKDGGLESAEFFKAMYLALIGKEKGPKLGPFIVIVGHEKVVSLIA